MFNLVDWCGQRRRSRINEKMKALQNLIPNSNKVHLFFSFFTPTFQLDLSNDCFGDYFSFFLILGEYRWIRLLC